MAADSKIITGDEGVLYAYDGTAWLPIGCLSSFTFNTSVAEKTRQTKCAPGVVTKGYGALDWTVDVDGFLVDTTSAAPNGDLTIKSWDWLLEKQIAKELIDIWIDAGLEDTQYYGSVIIQSLSMTSGTGDEDATFTATFGGSGDISNTDPHPTT